MSHVSVVFKINVLVPNPNFNHQMHILPTLKSKIESSDSHKNFLHSPRGLLEGMKMTRENKVTSATMKYFPLYRDPKI